MISSYSQTLAFGLSVNVATRVETQARSPRALTTAEPREDVAESPRGDRLTMFPEAAAGLANHGLRTQRRAEALFRALDADEDGSITQQEFTDGAAELLSHARTHRHGRGHDNGAGRSEGRRGDGNGGLAEALQRVFSAVDVDDNGAVTQDELTQALGRLRRHGRHGGDRPTTPAATPAEVTPAPDGMVPEATSPAASATPISTAPADVVSPAAADEGSSQDARQITVTRVTFVAVAIERYTSVAHSASEPQLSTAA